ncbi:MAG: hypothetical protein GX418_02655 [Clostridiales bacterium]|nr:hypothetical protein [Clostridiales bacterium]
MFEEWKQQMAGFVRKRLDRRPYRAIAETLDADIEELGELYTSVLLENGVIDATGEDTGLDFDEDDLIEAMLERFLQRHAYDGERDALYASLIDAYLRLVEEASEDL